MSRETVLLTGITGFLGSFLARDLINKGYKVYGLARAGKGISAYERVVDGLKFAYGNSWDERLVKKNLMVFEGNIIYPHLGLKSDKEEKKLIKEIDLIIHSAALAELNCDYAIIKRINVDGTKYLLDFSMKCKERGRLKKFNHISTMYIAGRNLSSFNESMHESGQLFNNTYERTKFEAEALVRKYLMEGLNCSIFRPSMVVGDSIEGKTSNFRLVYQPLKFFAKGVYEVFPADLDAWQNFIHVDIVTRTIAELASNEKSDVYHVISPNDFSIRDFLETAQNFFNIKMPIFMPPNSFDLYDLTPAKRALAKQFVPYFAYRTKFNGEKSLKIFNQFQVSHPHFTIDNLKRVFEFCIKENFL